MPMFVIMPTKRRGGSGAATAAPSRGIILSRKGSASVAPAALRKKRRESGARRLMCGAFMAELFMVEEFTLHDLGEQRAQAMVFRGGLLHDALHRGAVGE